MAEVRQTVRAALDSALEGKLFVIPDIPFEDVRRIAEEEMLARGIPGAVRVTPSIEGTHLTLETAGGLKPGDLKQ